MRQTEKDLLTIFDAALDSVAGRAVVANEFSVSGGDRFAEKFHVIAIGKAADAMLQGVPEARIISALLISKHCHISLETQQQLHVDCIESDHPIPHENSLIAGNKLLEFLKNLPGDEPIVFLISGGTSALVEVLHDDWDLSQLRQVTDYLLSNSHNINQINAVRRRLSKIKGGGLWEYIGCRVVDCLMISDVPGDDPVNIGSGLLFPDKDNGLPAIPEKWLDRMPPVKSIKQPANFKWKVVASLDIAKQAAAAKASELGYKTKVIKQFLDGEAAHRAVDCLAATKTEPGKLFIWGGETTVDLPENPGLGGRNQHLALAAAIAMQELPESYLLACGTDGSDGHTDASGAVVNQQTVSAGKQFGVDAQTYLETANANVYFEKTNSLITTGPTGTNVMDLVFAISFN